MKRGRWIMYRNIIFEQRRICSSICLKSSRTCIFNTNKTGLTVVQEKHAKILAAKNNHEIDILSEAERFSQ
jgi:hypothetical protein